MRRRALGNQRPIEGRAPRWGRARRPRGSSRCQSADQRELAGVVAAPLGGCCVAAVAAANWGWAIQLNRGRRSRPHVSAGPVLLAGAPAPTTNRLHLAPSSRLRDPAVLRGCTRADTTQVNHSPSSCRGDLAVPPASAPEPRRFNGITTQAQRWMTPPRRWPARSHQHDSAESCREGDRLRALPPRSWAHPHQHNSAESCSSSRAAFGRTDLCAHMVDAAADRGKHEANRISPPDDSAGTIQLNRIDCSASG